MVTVSSYTTAQGRRYRFGIARRTIDRRRRKRGFKTKREAELLRRNRRGDQGLSAVT